MYELVEAMYSEVSRLSIDPDILIKLAFIQYSFGICSMRRKIEEVDTNLAYRWFLGYGFHDKVPHFSTFGKNYFMRNVKKQLNVYSQMEKKSMACA